MSIVRAPRPADNFYILDKAISEDPRLSWEARGLLVYLLGKPDHWCVSNQALINETADSGKPAGREAVARMLNELIAVGYCTRVQPRLANGRLGPVDCHIHETPRAAGDGPAPAAAATASEPPAPAPAKKPKTQPAKPAAAKLPGAALGFDAQTGLFTHVGEAVFARWHEAFPRVNVPNEIVRAGSWLLANPGHAIKNYQRFLHNWMARTQDRAASQAPTAHAPGAPGSQHPQHPPRALSRAERVQADGAILTGIPLEAYQGGHPSTGRWTDWPSDTLDTSARVVPDTETPEGAR